MTDHSTIRSRAFLLRAADIDTDQIFPSRFQSRVDGANDLASFFFHDQRFDAKEQLIESFPLNNPALAGAQILVAPTNYACGSARAGAIFAHVHFGIRVLISESFGPVFPSVCYKFGLLPIELAKDDIAGLIRVLDDAPETVLEVDLEAQEIRLPTGATLAFRLDDYVRLIALSGKDEIGLTQSYQAEIEQFEQGRKQKFPWLFG